MDICRKKTLHIGLFATCLVDSLRPSIGFAAVKLLEQAGCKVSVPLAQTCCGQPAWNSGDRKTSMQLARKMLKEFAAFDYVIVPSGSCAATIIKAYPEMLANTADTAAAQAMADKTYELIAFLTDILGITQIDSAFEGKVTYHDSCSGLRSLHIKQQPRELLNNLKGVDLIEMVESETCCGFGGAFCVKFPDISGKMVSDKLQNAANTQADLVLGGDLGCLLNIAGRAMQTDTPIHARHIAEVLADMADIPAIGEESTS